ncbi:hypothetical protein ACFQZ8_31855, partial [Micromonospora azadirachtae]
ERRRRSLRRERAAARDGDGCPSEQIGVVHQDRDLDPVGRLEVRQRAADVRLHSLIRAPGHRLLK